MRKNVLVLGLGIGSVYVDELSKTHDVDTLDNNPELDTTYNELSDLEVIDRKKMYDIAIVCLPNFLHEPAIEALRDLADIILVEKPGLPSLPEWQRMRTECEVEGTRLVMAKNNMYRKGLGEFFDLVDVMIDHGSVKKVCISWVNNARIPNPGSWFTDKDKAWGGVGRDLMPHLLNELYMTMYTDPADEPCDWIKSAKLTQRYDIDSASKLCGDPEYANGDATGVYNVDDRAVIVAEDDGVEYHLTADWAHDYGVEDVGISVELTEGYMLYRLGLCPNECYGDMVNTMLAFVDDQTFWEEQAEIDDFTLGAIDYLYENGGENV